MLYDRSENSKKAWTRGPGPQAGLLWHPNINFSYNPHVLTKLPQRPGPLHLGNSLGMRGHDGFRTVWGEWLCWGTPFVLDLKHSRAEWAKAAFRWGTFSAQVGVPQSTLLQPGHIQNTARWWTLHIQKDGTTWITSEERDKEMYHRTHPFLLQREKHGSLAYTVPPVFQHWLSSYLTFWVTSSKKASLISLGLVSSLGPALMYALTALTQL